MDELPSGVGWKKPGWPVMVLLSAHASDAARASDATRILDMATSFWEDPAGRAHVRDQQPFLNIELHPLDRRPLDPEQPSP